VFQQLSQGALNVIASAVTPAVMISASAILISGISSKHSATSDRLRSLTEERRHPETSVSRRRSIEAQCALFLRRLRLILIGHLLLYGATALFVAMVFAIAASPLVGSYWVVFALFLAGVSTLLGALVFEMLELRLATRTLALETSDAMTEKTIKENPG
jgi:hypothetical protein